MERQPSDPVAAWRIFLPAVLAVALLSAWLYVTRCAPAPPLPEATPTPTMTALPPVATETLAPSVTPTETATPTAVPTVTRTPAATVTRTPAQFWTVQRGETMGHIALWVYGRAALWPDICAANERMAPYRCDQIFPGEALVLP